MAMVDSVTERAQARVGTVLKDKWRLDGVLGIGGMATVYAATHRNQNRVAIKMLHPEVSLDAEVTSRFLREGYVANTVGHPGIVSVLDDDVTGDGSAFLVMELLEGETVDARWARKGERLPVEEALPIIDQLLDVLESAHRRGVVHRDLKPENLFLTLDGRLKVLDFGIARIRELSKGHEVKTRAGSLLGTPAFMAPEQARGRWDEVDERTDIWAVGATLYTLVTGHFVHEAATVNEQLIAAATVTATPVLEFAPGLPLAVAELVDRALAFDKSARWPSATAMHHALRAAAESIEGAPLTVPRPSVSRAYELPTLMASPEAASAITGPRADTLTTARALTRSQSGPAAARGRSKWLALGVAGLLGVGAVVVLLGHGAPRPADGAGHDESHALAAAPTPHDDQRPGEPKDPVVSLATAPVVVPPPSATATEPSADHGHVTLHPVGRAVPSATQTPLQTPKADPPPTKPPPPATTGSNPFDRRH